MKILKKLLFVLCAAAVLLGGLYLFWLSPQYVVPILTYHRFGYEDNSLFVTPENFERQMEYLKTRGYRVISLDELVQGVTRNRKFDHKTAVITIDDGWQDNYTYAYPVLQKYGFPATIFLAAGSIGTNPEFLTWEQARAMRQGNIVFGCHTKGHTYLPAITSGDLLRDEIAGCKTLLEEKLGVPVTLYCYPTGGFTDAVKTMVRKSGFTGACTTARGFAGLNQDLYELKRVKVTNSDTRKPFSFWAKLSGYYNMFRRKKAGD